MNTTIAHNERIIDQFTKQSIPFTNVEGHHDAIDVLISLSKVNSSSNVLDVACGPGLVSCEFAKFATEVTGLDVTPAMLESAQNRQRELGLTNVAWQLGDALSLPFDDNTFDIVATRYSFHHLLEPSLALQQMIRVCKSGGVILVADVAIPEDKSANYDKLELLRDPSHTHALSETEFDNLFQMSGLINCSYTEYSVEIELESQLKASFPYPGDDVVIRNLITKDMGHDQLGIRARHVGNQILYSVPIRVYVGWKNA